MTQLPIHLSGASGVPFYRQIVDQIAQMVRAGQLPPGTLLPSVRDLAGQLLVSLITTRRAYSDLEAAGLIVRRQGHGTFVAEGVEMATREQAVSEVQDMLSRAVAHAKQTGLDEETLRGMFERAVESEGVEEDGR